MYTLHSIIIKLQLYTTPCYFSNDFPKQEWFLKYIFYESKFEVHC